MQTLKIGNIPKQKVRNTTDIKRKRQIELKTVPRRTQEVQRTLPLQNKLIKLQN